MKGNKSTLFRFSVGSREKMEAYLEKMARKGWLLVTVSGGMFRFKRTAPKMLRYCVFFSSEEMDSRYDVYGKAQELYELCACAGWTVAAAVGRLHIFYSEDLNAVPIETECEPKRERHINRIERWSGLDIAVMVLMLLNAVLKVLSIRKDPYTYLADSNVLLLIGMYGVVAIWGGSKLVYDSIWRRRLKATPHNAIISQM